MPAATSGADTIRILVATDNHVGYKESDPVRYDDSWKAFDEVLSLAKERDVDMILLAGDLFHENKPSRKSIYDVMRSLREHCLGDKPCELQFMSDGSEVFGGAFNHVNYEDPDINVSIPVFSIHGNHDDPSGNDHLASLDILQTAGLINYYGRTSESDSIEIKPILLQKGRTKLALYGMSNVRDERLFRTFRDGKVKFFQPGVQKNDWFNLMSVHQNHVGHTATGYLPESFLPKFLDLVIWGHEHECLIEPRKNDEMGFYVSQPGSSIATSLMPGEAAIKQVGLLSITGKEFTMEPIRLKSVRPFKIKSIVLADEPEMKNIAKKSNNRTAVIDFLTREANTLIEEANEEWKDAQDPETIESGEFQIPKPLIRLRVDYGAPEGCRFEVENPQRFSQRFAETVANTDDVITFHRKKALNRRKNEEIDMPDEEVLANLKADTVKVEELVREFLSAQSLTMLPHNSFGDAVGRFIDKDDKESMGDFLKESLQKNIDYLMAQEDIDEVDFSEAVERSRLNNEEAFEKQAHVPRAGATNRPADDEDMDADNGEATLPPRTTTTSTRGRGRGRNGKATAGSTAKSTAAKASGRGRGKKQIDEEEDDDEESDINMVLEDSDEEALFVSEPATKKKAPPKTTSTAKSTRTRAAATRQTTINFSQPSRSSTRASVAPQKVVEISDDEISDDDDDDDAFEPAPPKTQTRTRRR